MTRTLDLDETARRRLDRQINEVLDEVTRLRHYKGFADEVKPLYVKRLVALNAELVRHGGMARKITL